MSTGSRFVGFWHMALSDIGFAEEVAQFGFELAPNPSLARPTKFHNSTCQRHSSLRKLLLGKFDELSTLWDPALPYPERS